MAERPVSGAQGAHRPRAMRGCCIEGRSQAQRWQDAGLRGGRALGSEVPALMQRVGWKRVWGAEAAASTGRNGQEDGSVPLLFFLRGAWERLAVSTVPRGRAALRSAVRGPGTRNLIAQALYWP